MLCKLINPKDNHLYSKEFSLMETLAPGLLLKKIKASLHQSAQILHCALEYATKDNQILCVGSYEDVPAEVLTRLGYNVIGVDPTLNVNLHSYKLANPSQKFDIVISTSVIEHVQDDEQFIIDICDMMKPGALCFITCDFKPTYVEGDPLPATCVRLYTNEGLQRLARIVKFNNCELTEEPSWNITEQELDFEWDGVRYCFVGMSFKKEQEKL